VTLVLSAADRQALQQLIKHDPHWRVRERAQSVLLLATGLTCQQVAEQQALSMQTVSATRRRWLAQAWSACRIGPAAVPRPNSPPRRRSSC
jgi:DNA-binding NarL/FixJ family response regulator